MPEPEKEKDRTYMSGLRYLYSTETYDLCRIGPFIVTVDYDWITGLRCAEDQTGFAMCDNDVEVYRVSDGKLVMALATPNEEPFLEFLESNWNTKGDSSDVRIRRSAGCQARP